MEPVERALWFVERHSRKSITLDDISDACGVSKFHLSRAFTSVTGWPLMRYVRSRRLSIAAQRLADGASDILNVALESGYNSHEAFTRAFREQFGVTPDHVRSTGTTEEIGMVPAMTMPKREATDLTPPEFKTTPGLRFAGISKRYAWQEPGGIPEQWQRFAPYIGTVAGQVGEDAYGISYDFDEEGTYSYLCGVVVAERVSVPNGFDTIASPKHSYALFSHADHVAGVPRTYRAIWRDWFPHSGFLIANTPTLERYPPHFDPHTGHGGVEIWIPIEKR